MAHGQESNSQPTPEELTESFVSGTAWVQWRGRRRQACKMKKYVKEQKERKKEMDRKRRKTCKRRQTNERDKMSKATGKKRKTKGDKTMEKEKIEE